MAKKQFKTESKKLLDMMINSIYTNREIFLREIISNASDAIDKIYFRSLTDTSVGLNRDKYEIRITPNKEERTLTISDNGCGMSMEELEKNLGTIAKSGSLEFKSGLNASVDEGKSEEEKHDTPDIDVIGQFGVGFYSAFMVSDKITVISRTYDSETASVWESTGADGYTISESEKDAPGTEVILHIKEDNGEDNYSTFLEEYTIRNLIRKYSDFIRYPIRMMCDHTKLKDGTGIEVDGKYIDAEYDHIMEDDTLNTITPIWKRPASEVDKESYNSFYKEKFFDYEDPLKVITQRVEGVVSYDTLLYIPGRAPYNYYTKEFEKGLQLYSSGVMIMDKCKDLVPDYFSFVKGVVDSPDLSLNISRELLQHDRQLKVIARNIENKIKAGLLEMQEKERADYEKFFEAFGMQLKYGIYSDFGMHKDVLQDLLIFKSSSGKQVTLKEYVSNMKEGQEKIYYAPGTSEEQIKMLPQVEAVTGKEFEVLYFTDEVDEFAVQTLQSYMEKAFSNVCSDELDLGTEEEKEKLKSENENSKEVLEAISFILGDSVKQVRFTNSLKDYAACISNEGMISANMEKTINQMAYAGMDQVKAELVLEINIESPVAEKIKKLYDEDKDKLKDYAVVLYENARIVSGLEIENPARFSKLVSKLMA